MRLAIADPPYPPRFAERRTPGGDLRITKRSRARRYYGEGTRPREERPADFHPDAGAWDDPSHHRALLERLCDEYDGWAIATTPDGLESYRPLPISCREAVIVCTPESRRGGRGQLSDVLIENAPRIGFPGAKPERWTRWVLDALGYDEAADTVADLFPGSGSVAKAIAAPTLNLDGGAA